MNETALTRVSPGAVVIDDDTGQQARRLPPILHGKATPEVIREVEAFYGTVAEMFEAWVTRRRNKKTQATYRNHVLKCVEWFGIRWPECAHELFQVTVEDVTAYRDFLVTEGTPQKTVHGRLCALSRFFEYLIRMAAKGKLPINVFNPAHQDFVEREGDAAENPAPALSVEQLHELLALPSGDGVLEHRDRAILTVAAAMGFRVSTLVRLEVHDVYKDPVHGSVVTYWQKGDRKEKPQGMHPKAFVAVEKYKAVAEVTSGALFRPQAGRKVVTLADRAMSGSAMSQLLQRYLDRVSGGIVLRRDSGGQEVSVSHFSPHSIRATFATVLDQQGVPRPKIQAGLGHAKPETTDGYCQTEFAGRDAASHAMPI